MCDWHIEKMRPEHLEQVLALESQCFPTLAWDAKCFLYEMEENPFGNYFIGYLNNEPVGYVGLHIIFETCHITTIGIHTNFRQQGYGQKMLAYALDYARVFDVQTVSLEVRVSNTVAKKLYMSFGFQEGTVRKNYYSDNQEDAILMWVKL